MSSVRFRELNETEMYSNVTDMDATIERDTIQNTNSLISSGYFIENYSEGDSDKENNSKNNTANKWPHACRIFTANK